MGIIKRTYTLNNGTTSTTYGFDIRLKGHPRARGSWGHVPRTMARELFAKEMAKVLEGKWQPRRPSAPTLKSFWGRFVADYQSHAADTSIARYIYASRAFLPILGAKRLTQITPEVIDQYRQERRAQGRSAVTINREVGAIRHALHAAARWHVIAPHPLADVKRLREYGRERILSDAEEDRLLFACQEPLRGLVTVALDTGFRESELVSLTARSVNWSHRRLTVQSGYAKNRETRTVEMTHRVAVIIEQRMADLRSLPADGPLLGYAHVSSVKRAFRRARQRANLPDVRFHDLRHTFATRLVLAGVRLDQVQRLLGHKTIAMTMRYLNLTGEDLKGVIGVLNREKMPAVLTAVDHGSP